MSFGAFTVRGIVGKGRGKAMARGIRALLPASEDSDARVRRLIAGRCGFYQIALRATQA